jgi:hypothetical protein
MLGVLAEFETNMQRERQHGRPAAIDAARVRTMKAEGNVCRVLEAEPGRYRMLDFGGSKMPLLLTRSIASLRTARVAASTKLKTGVKLVSLAEVSRSSSENWSATGTLIDMAGPRDSTFFIVLFVCQICNNLGFVVELSV